MRKLIFLLCILATFANAQTKTLNFCDAFPLLEKSATNGFSDIIKELDPNTPYPKTYFSSIQLKDAIFSGIVKKSGNFSYNADFGTFGTMEEARKKVREITEALKVCYPGFKATISTEKILNTEYHTFSNHNEHGFRLYDARFEILPLSKKFYVTFKFDAGEEEDILNNNPSMAYYDYTLIKRAPVNDEFSIAFRNVIEESKTAFSAIIGNSTDFGRGFTNTTDGSSLTYAHQSQPEKPVVRMIQIEKNDSFVFELQFYNQE